MWNGRDAGPKNLIDLAVRSARIVSWYTTRHAAGDLPGDCGDAVQGKDEPFKGDSCRYNAILLSGCLASSGVAHKN
jgi:hypothetical protein